jgi:hypothetical protein
MFPSKHTIINILCFLEVEIQLFFLCQRKLSPERDNPVYLTAPKKLIKEEKKISK